MTEKEIRKILKGTFADPNDRKYWENKLADTVRREQTHKETVANMRRYERGVSAFKKGKRK